MPQRGFLWIYPISDLFSFLNLQVPLLPSPGGFSSHFFKCFFGAILSSLLGIQ